MNHKKKSATKASGFKSAFIVGDKVVTTSFGKGNTAILEKEVTDDVVRELNTKDSNYALDIITEKGKKKYKIKGKWINKLNEDNTDSDSDDKKIVTGDDPREYSIMRDDDVERIGMDAIRIKDKVEEEIFGKAFPEDNIHIQLAYNILDIKKLLAVHVNNIIYSLNNLAHRSNSIPSTDSLGNILANITIDEFNNPNESTEKTKDRNIKKIKDVKKFIDEIKKYKEYLPEAFSTGITESKKKTFVKAWQQDDDIYTMLRILSDVRQSCVHGYNYIFDYDDNEKTTPSLIEKRRYLDRVYKNKIDRVNNNFLEFNKTDIHILFDIYKLSESQEVIANQYYNFIMLQDFKNLGFSIKEIRERMIDKYIGRLKEKNYDSLRSRMYRLVDFIIYKYYISTTDIDEFVGGLRASLSDEERNKIYNQHCDLTYTNCREKLDFLIQAVNSDSITSFISKNKPPVKISKTIESNATYFTKIIHLITLFLDGKEINELINSLIKKFNDITEFVSVLREYKVDGKKLGCSFNREYKLFGKKSVSQELRMLKSIARMKVEIITSKNAFCDAVCILGLNDKNGKLILEYNDEQNKYLEHYVNNKIFDNTKPENERDKTLKNFLINNVIKSRRFWYVIRYINPKSARRLMSNKEIIAFVLKRLPDAQINRYYTSVTDKPIDGITVAEQKKYLCEELLKMNINRFEKVPKFAKDGAKKIQKERYKAIIGLYLTVLYLLTKNLVNVNSRYTIACCCLERDSILHGLIEENEYKENGEPDYKKICDRLVDKAINEKWINKRYRGYFINSNKDLNIKAGRDRNHYHKQLHIVFRNAIVHLNAVMEADKYIEGIKNIDSYFMIYHYIMQRYIVQNAKLAWINQTPAFKNQFESAVEHNTYSKNVVKGLCLPFGYNLSRFKNLTVMEVFNRKEILEERKKAAENKD